MIAFGVSWVKIATWLGLVTQGITRLVNNDFLAILVMGDSILLLRLVIARFHQCRYS